ncbi:exported hypothetical protein [Escherichia coli]|nr:exported hypothetical protein [Escherichia coli]
MKKLTVAALAVATLLSGSAFAHEAGEFLFLPPYLQTGIVS